MRLIEDPKHGDVIDAYLSMYPTKIQCVEECEEFYFEPTTTVYGICISGKAAVLPADTRLPEFDLTTGSVFTMAGGFNLSGEGFKVFLISRLGYRGMLGLSHIEDRGRLAYIDGCSDTCIFPPARLGDPCLNTLHFPKRIDQTQHLHPDIRVGVVVSGNGIAYRKDHWSKTLCAGSMFILDESDIHSFKTLEEGMTVVAYHPTTDFGPTDQNHPMLNRTYIDHGK